MSNRIRNKQLQEKIVTVQEAADVFRNGMNVGISGFSLFGCPKLVMQALADRLQRTGEQLKINLWSGASSGPENDGALAAKQAVAKRLPYQSDKDMRELINNGTVGYLDQHLSHVPQALRYGWYGKLDVAVIEALAITEAGDIIPTTGVGNSPTFVDAADIVIVELNTAYPEIMEGMHDIYVPADPAGRDVIPLRRPEQRIGSPYIKAGPDKIDYIVLSDYVERGTKFAPVEPVHERIAAHLIEFLEREIKIGRLPPHLLPLQSGVGSVANAVLTGLVNSDFQHLTVYSEVLQDAILDLLDSGKLDIASGCAVNLSAAGQNRFYGDIERYRSNIILRPQEITNHPEIIRRLGLIAMNTAIEADIYGNVNSTHIMGTKMMNGIGGSGDFARNSYLSIFITESVAKNGNISSLVPMVSHVDHTEHDVAVLITEQGVADLRGLTPRERAGTIIRNCAHPDYRAKLQDYFDRAVRTAGGQTPHLLAEAFAWHMSFLNNGTMR